MKRDFHQFCEGVAMQDALQKRTCAMSMSFPVPPAMCAHTEFEDMQDKEDDSHYSEHYREYKAWWLWQQQVLLNAAGVAMYCRGPH